MLKFEKWKSAGRAAVTIAPCGKWRIKRSSGGIRMVKSEGPSYSSKTHSKLYQKVNDEWVHRGNFETVNEAKHAAGYREVECDWRGQKVA